MLVLIPMTILYVLLSQEPIISSPNGLVIVRTLSLQYPFKIFNPEGILQIYSVIIEFSLLDSTGLTVMDLFSLSFIIYFSGVAKELILNNNSIGAAVINILFIY